MKHVVLGRVNGVFGVRGWLKIFSYSTPRENIFSYKPLCFETQGGTWRESRLVDWKKQGKGLVAQFEGIENRSEALSYVGLNIGVTRESLPPLSDDEYYWCDLLGLEVVDEDRNELGKIVEVRETGANDVLVVEGDEKHLIPFLKGNVVKHVDIGGGKMVVDWTGDYI